MRQRRPVYLPLTLSLSLIAINITLMVFWIIVWSSRSPWGLTIGTIAFGLSLLGLTVYMILTIKERRFSQRQVNFVDSVTHELKSPIASLRLYLQTLQMHQVSEDERDGFYQTMSGELERLDDLINQLLQVARLDAIGHDTPSEDVQLENLLETCGRDVCLQHYCRFGETFSMELLPVVVKAPRIMLEMIFRNLFDNALKYGGQPPRVAVKVMSKRSGMVSVQVIDNGPGLPADVRKNMFRLFYRGGNELRRKEKGTGVGLYIVQTLVRQLRGRIAAFERPGGAERQGSESVFQIDLPGVVEPVCES